MSRWLSCTEFLCSKDGGAKKGQGSVPIDRQWPVNDVGSENNLICSRTTESSTEVLHLWVTDRFY